MLPVFHLSLSNVKAITTIMTATEIRATDENACPTPFPDATCVTLCNTCPLVRVRRDSARCRSDDASTNAYEEEGEDMRTGTREWLGVWLARVPIRAHAAHSCPTVPTLRRNPAPRPLSFGLVVVIELRSRDPAKQA